LHCRFKINQIELDAQPVPVITNVVDDIDVMLVDAVYLFHSNHQIILIVRAAT
jgi:hypothetical protein